MPKIAKVSLFLFLNLMIIFSIYLFKKNFQVKSEIKEKPLQILDVEQFIKNNNDLVEKTEDKKEITNQNLNIDKWEIEIPCINLKAKIKEGITSDVLNDYVGHFPNTQIEEGNIGLAAHNRGYKNNYFRDVKKLKEGDEIFYIHNEYKETYVVVRCEIIKDDDWSYLEDTSENVLTLITCVENEPEFRRCLQANKKEMEEIY